VPPFSSSSAPPPPRSSAAAGRRATPPEAPLPLLASTRRPRARPRLNPSCWTSPSAPHRSAARPSRHRSPLLQLCQHHLLLWQLPRIAPRLPAALALLLWPSSAHATPSSLCPSTARPPRRAAGRQQLLRLAVPLLSPTAWPGALFDFFYPLARP
jgi:hypothetical protein